MRFVRIIAAATTGVGPFVVSRDDEAHASSAR